MPNFSAAQGEFLIMMPLIPNFKNNSGDKQITLVNTIFYASDIRVNLGPLIPKMILILQNLF